MTPPPVVLSIAGLDPSSGAGISADVKTIAANGCYGTVCVTALTVQSTRGVKEVFAVPPALVRGTLRELAADLPLAAVRIGMLGAGDVAREVADFLESLVRAAVVLDPVMVASSGASLLDAEALEILRTRLLPRADVSTPNVSEATALTGIPVSHLEDMKMAAARFHDMGGKAVVIKGGHLPPASLRERQISETALYDNAVVDLLSMRGTEGTYVEEFHGTRVRLHGGAVHGAGCAFATALACGLALGRTLPDAVASARQFVTTAMARAYPLGSGPGPVHHLYRLDEPQR